MSFSSNPDQIIEDLRTENAALRQLLVERKRYSFQLIDSPLVGMYIAQMNGLICEANTKFLAMSGYSQEDVDAERVRWDEMTPPEHIATSVRVREQLTKTQHAGPWEKEILTKDGRRVSVLVSVSRSDTSTEEFVVFMVDITARKLAEKALEESEARFRVLADASFEGIGISENGNFVLVNRQFERILGAKPGELIGKRVFDFVGRDDIERVQRRQDSNGDDLGEFTAIRVDGSRVPIESVAKSCMYHGRPARVGAIRDISVQKKAREDLEAALLAAQEANRAKSDFVAMASHEIRTPMNGILGMVELLLETQLTDSQREDISLIKSSAESLLDIINDILDLSKVNAGKMELTQKIFDVRSCIQGALKPLQSRANEKGLKLTSYVGPNVPVTLVGDSGRIRQVIVNLVSNAIKFTSSGAISIEVGSRIISDKQEELRVIVADTGKGIAPGKLQNLFEPFVQAGSVPTSDGTGLGLAICRKLVRLMGGEIEARSEIGVGSTFTFTLRLEREAPFSSSELLSIPPNSRSSVTPSSKRSYRVLVAEDNKVNQHFVTKMLKKKNHVVTVAETGRQAVDIFQSQPIDIVLMDVQMPEMDGYMATQEIRAVERQRGTRIPIIAMTAHAMSGDREKCLTMGMDGYVSKPIRFDELFHLIDHLMSGITSSVTLVPKSRVELSSRRCQFELAQLLDHVAGDSDLLKQMAHIFLDSAGKYRARVQSAIDKQDASEIELASHAIRGMAGNFLAMDTVRAAEKLEEAGRSRSIENSKALWSELDRLLSELTLDVQQLTK